jgi:hypothetical protein
LVDSGELSYGIAEAEGDREVLGEPGISGTGFRVKVNLEGGRGRLRCGGGAGVGGTDCRHSEGGAPKTEVIDKAPLC